jgi:hypothetical protein
MANIPFFEILNNSINQIGFYLDNTIKFGDFITAIAILISLISLLISLRKDRNLRQKQQADIVRSCAARTLAKLDRWKEISLSMFDRLDIIFVNTSTLWAKNENGEVLKDLLWMKIDKERVKNLENIKKEEIESSYNDLYGFDPYARAYFEYVLDLLKEEEEIMYRKALQPGIQDIVKEMQNEEGERWTANFRNALAIHANHMREIYESRLSLILQKVSDSLLELIKKKDDKILSISKNSYFKDLVFNIVPVSPDNYGIITAENTAIILSQPNKKPPQS